MTTALLQLKKVILTYGRSVNPPDLLSAHYLIPIFKCLFLVLKNIQGRCVVLNRRLPVSVVPLPVNLLLERRSATRAMVSVW